MVLLAAGIGMVVSAASLFFRDVKFIVEVLLTFGIFFTPVFYDDASMFGDKGKWLLLNPIAPFWMGSAHVSPTNNRRICLVCVQLRFVPCLRFLAGTFSSSIWNQAFAESI